MRIGEILQSSVRSRDVAIRLGGDEFLVLLPGSGIREAAAFADRISGLIAGSPWESSSVHRPTLSVGIAIMPESGSDDLELLLRRADQALYTSKRAGRNRVTAWAAA